MKCKHRSFYGRKKKELKLQEKKSWIHDPVNVKTWKGTDGHRYYKCMDCGIIANFPIGRHECFDQTECKLCYDKGYYTELMGGQTLHPDFEGDKTTKTGPILIVRFCTCKQGKLAQRRKKSIMVFETKLYKLPTEK